EAMFHTGWFVESLATQVLVVFAIRTRRSLFHSRPHPALGGLAAGIVMLGVALPFTPLAQWFGFEPLSPGFLIYLAVATVVYLALIELIKSKFYRYFSFRRKSSRNTCQF